MESSFFEKIYTVGVIPVLQINRADRAAPLAESLFSGGLPIAEITLRTEAALESIRGIARDVPHILVGAGTVINREQAEAACEARGIYLFESEAAAQSYLAGLIVAALKSSPAVCNISAKLFDVLESHTAITRGPVKSALDITD
jgi:2-keto-3-deoxy-6-phosphogluconate aldolase